MKFRQIRDAFWSTSQPWARMRLWLVPRLIRAAHCGLMCTLRFSYSGRNHDLPYLESEQEVGAFLLLWHEHTLSSLHVWQDSDIWGMMSRSRAGTIQAALWRLYGFPTVWGSSTRPREAVQALRDAVKTLKEGHHFALTPDGPKGPPHVAQSGAVWIASNSGAPIMPLGFAFERAWRLSTWDKYIIPKPFSRVHVHVGPPVLVPLKLARAETEEWRQRIQDALTQANEHAETHLQTSQHSTRRQPASA